MTLLTRSTLKNLFKRGSVPSEVNFSDLIDSTINKVDDGFAQSQDHGFMLAPQGKNKKMLSFFESIRDSDSSFSLSLNPDRHSSGLSIDDKEHQSILFLKDNGQVGVGTTSPKFKLEVAGMAGMNGRVGTFASGEVKADGEWQTIISGLEGINAFEMIAQASGPQGRGKYALTYAVGLCNFGSGTIRHLKSSYSKTLGFLFHRISFRWVMDGNEYKLQVRTFNNYGDDNGKHCTIKYYISKLWDNSMFPESNNTRE